MKTFWKAIGVGALALVAYCYGMNVGMNSIIDQISPEECRRLLKNRKIGMEVRTLRPDLVAKEREYEAEDRKSRKSMFGPLRDLFYDVASSTGEHDEQLKERVVDELMARMRNGGLRIVIEAREDVEEA